MSSYPQIVLDTSAFIAALLSKQGAAHQLLLRAGDGLFQMNLSVPLVMEYEAVGKRLLSRTAMIEDDLDDILDYLCAVGRPCEIHFLWRPYLRDPGDDMVLEVAVAAEAPYIVTFNKRDFAGAERFGIEVLTPGEFLPKLGAQL